MYTTNDTIGNTQENAKIIHEKQSNDRPYQSSLSSPISIEILLLLSVLGNGLVLVISYRRRKKMVGSELLCVNLAVVDFLCCICFYPLSILSSFNHAWLGHHVTCVYYGLGCYIFGLCGMFTIAAITVWLDGANIRLVCCASWLIAAVWSSFPLFGWGEYVPEPYGLSCTIAWHSYHTSFKDAFYVICSFSCFMLVPVLLIVMSQIQILYKVYHFTYALVWTYTLCITKQRTRYKKTQHKIESPIMGKRDNRYMAPGGFVFPALFAKSSHIYNPFIYFYFNKAFRQELHFLLRSFCPRLARNRVGVRSAIGQEGLPGGPHPIQIQLQELGMSGGGVLGEE
uniref:Opsin 8, group member c n=1 Tax=Oncorhynchus mykiss TaxID=8022 RepID=A0A8K9Y7X0_ONCMY